MNLIDLVEQEQLKKDLPAFGPGDTVRVHLKVVEGERERIQVFEGVVIARAHGASARPYSTENFRWNWRERIFPPFADDCQD